MKNLLFVSISFPPKNDPECLQTARYFKYLQQTGKFRITVVTTEIPTLYMPENKSLWRYMEGIDQLIKIRTFEYKWLNFGLRKIGLGSILFPDSKMTFYWQWRKVVKQLKFKPDFIYSRSNPISSSFMARKLKAHYNCPWVLHMSDPWAFSPVIEMQQELRERAIREESDLFSKANRITFTTEGTKSIYANRYPHEATKFSVLPNVYDPTDVLPSMPPPNDKLRIVYTGGLVGQRNISSLLPVLAEADKRFPNLDQMVEFVFAGDMDRESRALFLNTRLCMKHVGLLDYEDAKKLYQKAHILLVIDNPTSSGDAIFFPSKLLDYFLAKKKIWAITPENSTTRQVLKEINHAAFNHSETNAMANFLEQSIESFKLKKFETFESTHIPANYSAEINGALLAELISKTVVSS